MVPGLAIGTAYVFVGSGMTWSQQANLTALDGSVNDTLGYSAAISGSTALLGAYRKNSFTGAAYVFVLPSSDAELRSNSHSGDLG